MGTAVKSSSPWTEFFKLTSFGVRWGCSCTCARWEAELESGGAQGDQGLPSNGGVQVESCFLGEADEQKMMDSYLRPVLWLLRGGAEGLFGRHSAGDDQQVLISNFEAEAISSRFWKEETASQ